VSGKVVHCKQSDYDVYIGRGQCPKTGKMGKWGNPYLIGKHGNRQQVIEKYRQYLFSSPDLLRALPELKGKVLACWCAPEPCHGDVLLELAEDGCVK